MKKLNFMFDAQRMTKEQMKRIFGGENPDTCSSTSKDWCGHTTDNAYHQCGLSEDDAMNWDKYCCTHCPIWP